ncbi:MAG: hypothetical protein M3411_04275 [Chloroflexota bacterium]|nr:hypothetical protein [Chloroflexia bacterium]MDQ3467436.1 hypothetical protein [Chloroflexota bacterium]
MIRRLNMVATIGAVILVVLLMARYIRINRGLATGSANEDTIWLLIALLFLGFCLTVFVLQPERAKFTHLVWTAVFWSVALLIVLSCVWYLVDADVREQIGLGEPIFNQAELDRYLAAAGEARPGVADASLPRVPTGVLIQSIVFEDANTVHVTGFVWQRYDASIPENVARGFVLPEALSEAYQNNKVYDVMDNGTQVIGWYLDATIRQEFDYRRYPFDRQDFWLRIWHRDFNRAVILVPDFSGYTTMDPLAKAGIDSQIVSAGWDPEYTAFSYVTHPYDSTFGYPGAVTEGTFPELYFNVGLKRDFLGPFFDHIILNLAVAVLLFFILILTTNDEDLQKRFGFSASGVATASSGLLFAVILKHNQIRSVVGSQRIVYLEVLPVALYVMILLVAINGILIASPFKIPFIEYRKNILPVLCYWPLLLSMLLAATILIFYI